MDMEATVNLFLVGAAALAGWGHMSIMTAAMTSMGCH